VIVRLAALLTAFLTGCSAETAPGPAGPATCESVGAALCDKACSCAAGGECALTRVSDAGSVTIGFDSSAHCRELVNANCNKPSDTDWQACRQKVASTQCLQSSGGGAAVIVSCTD